MSKCVPDPLVQMIENGKLAIFDIEGLVKLIKKNKSIDTFDIPKKLPTPFEVFRTQRQRERERSLLEEKLQTTSRLPFLSANELEATYRTLDSLQRCSPNFLVDFNEDLGNFSSQHPLRSYNLSKEPYIIGQNRRSLLDRGSLFHSNSLQPRRDSNKETLSQAQSVWNAGPPRRNDGTGSVTDLMKSRGVFIPELERRRQTPLVGDLPFRFPMHNTLSNALSRNVTARPRRNFSNQFLLEEFGTCYQRDDARKLDTFTWKQRPRNLERRSFNPFSEENEVDTPGESMLEFVATYPTVVNTNSATSTTNTRTGQSKKPGYKSKVILTKQNYYCKPSVEELDELTTLTGTCAVSNFEIGHSQWGKVIFDEEFDLSGLNLDNSIQFGHKEVRLYTMGRTPCPPVNQGLNRPATVLLYKVFPTNCVTKRTITDPAKLRHLNFEGKLREKTASSGWTFINYNPTSGNWTYKVPFFNHASITPFRRDQN